MNEVLDIINETRDKLSAIPSFVLTTELINIIFDIHDNLSKLERIENERNR